MGRENFGRLGLGTSASPHTYISDAVRCERRGGEAQNTGEHRAFGHKRCSNPSLGVRRVRYQRLKPVLSV